MLDLTTAYLTKLAAVGVDDLFMLCSIEGAGVPTQHLSLGTRTLAWGASAEAVSGPLLLPADRETYVATDGAYGTKRETLDSEPPNNNLTITNLDGAWYDAVHAQALDYNSVNITFKMVFASVDPSGIQDSLRSRIEDGPYLISGVGLSDDGIQFSFGAAFNALKMQVPVLLSRARRCQFLYKGADGNCGSTSTLVACDKSPHQCAQRQGGILRFSAWPFSNRRAF